MQVPLILRTNHFLDLQTLHLSRNMISSKLYSSASDDDECAKNGDATVGYKELELFSLHGDYHHDNQHHNQNPPDSSTSTHHNPSNSSTSTQVSNSTVVISHYSVN